MTDDDDFRRAIADIAALAARQEAFAGPEYTQNTDADRRAFRHAAAMLRFAAELLAARRGTKK